MNKFSLPMVLFTVFLVCKLAQVTTIATWSWWWVFSPLFVPLGIVLILTLMVGACTTITNAIVNKRKS